MKKNHNSDDSDSLMSALSGLKQNALRAHRSRDPGLLIRIGMMEEPKEDEKPKEGEESSEVVEHDSETCEQCALGTCEECEPTEDDLLSLIADEEDDEDEDEG